MAGSLEIRPSTLDEVKEIGFALNIANEANMTKDEREIQWKRYDFIMLQKGALDKSRKDGLAEGRVEGIAKGRVEGRAEGIKEGVEKGRMEGITQIILQMSEVGFLVAENCKNYQTG